MAILEWHSTDTYVLDKVRGRELFRYVRIPFGSLHLGLLHSHATYAMDVLRHFQLGYQISFLREEGLVGRRQALHAHAARGLREGFR